MTDGDVSRRVEIRLSENVKALIVLPILSASVPEMEHSSVNIANARTYGFVKRAGPSEIVSLGRSAHPKSFLRKFEASYSRHRRPAAVQDLFEPERCPAIVTSPVYSWIGGLWPATDRV